MRTSIGILDDGAYEVSAYRTDGTRRHAWGAAIQGADS